MEQLQETKKDQRAQWKPLASGRSTVFLLVHQHYLCMLLTSWSSDLPSLFYEIWVFRCQKCTACIHQHYRCMLLTSWSSELPCISREIWVFCCSKVHSMYAAWCVLLLDVWLGSKLSIVFFLAFAMNWSRFWSRIYSSKNIWDFFYDIESRWYVLVRLATTLDDQLC